MKISEAAQAINQLNPQEMLEISVQCLASGLEYFTERKLAAAELFFALAALIESQAKSKERFMSDEILNAEFLYD